MIGRSPLRYTLHVGLPKCASTSIQAYFAGNYKKHLLQGVFYPHEGRLPSGYRSHLPLFTNFKKLDARLDSIQRKARCFRARRVVLSTEAIMDRIPSGVHAQCLLHVLDRLGRENVDIIAVSRSPSGLIRSSYDQFLLAGLWEVERQKLFDTSEARIEDFLNAFKDLWGFELKEIDKIFPLFAERYNVSRIVEIPLSADGDHVLSRIAKEVGLKSADKLPVKNAGRSTKKALMFRDFQKKYGVAAFQRNLKVLRQVHFPDRELSAEETDALGLTLPKKVNTLLDENYVAETRVHEFPYP